MKIRIWGVVALLLCWCPEANSQQKTTLSGYLKDGQSSEALAGATIFVKELNIGTQTNTYGFYSVTVPPGSYTFIFSYVGYKTRMETINLVSSKEQDITLDNQNIIQEVEVSTQRKDHNVEGSEMGTVTLSIDRVKTLPVIFGEVDILKTLQLLPGVQSAGEGNSGFYVRGGGPDQNLILLDDAVVYNTGHLFGFFSVFNGDALKNTTLIKGGMPANYGGRLSSVVDVTMKEGNLKQFHGEGGIGLIASRLTLEGPIKKDKGSFMLSARRTYIDLLIKPFVKPGGAFYGSGYFFYDVNLKGNYILSPKDRIYLSGYFGRDKFSFTDGGQSFKATIPWGNNTATLRYNHQFNNKLFSNTSLIYNAYDFKFTGEQQNFTVALSSGITDYNVKEDFDWFTSFNHHLKFGGQYVYHRFMPSTVSGHSDTTNLSPPNPYTKYAHEAGLYLLDEFNVGSRIKVNAGLRYSGFGQIGPYKRYKYGFDGKTVTDSTTYKAGEFVQYYGGWEPRLNVRYALNEASSVKASITKTYQYVHLVTNNGSTLPTDIWVPSTQLVKPGEAWQYSAGYFRNFLDNALETSVEVYYKDLNNLIEYRSGYAPTSIHDQELDYVFGKGKAYGIELFINKTKGKFTGWVGYTLAWTYEYFPNLNSGNPFPAKYDRHHDISVVGQYNQSKKWTFTSVFVFGSGNAITLPTNFYIIDAQLTQEYSAINAYRIFPYHRLDIAAIYTPQHAKPRKFKTSWTFSIYNVYSRQNPYFLFVDSRGNTASGITVTVKQVSIFPILPSVTYNFNF